MTAFCGSLKKKSKMEAYIKQGSNLYYKIESGKVTALNTDAKSVRSSMCVPSIYANKVEVITKNEWESARKSIGSKPSHSVMNIVNGLYELAGLSPEKRHILNDRADEFVADVLAKEPKGSELNEAIRLLNLLKESYYSPNKHIKQAVSYFLDKHLKK